MARGYSQSRSERTQSLLGVPGPQIGEAVNAIVNKSGTMGGKFINAFNLYNEMTEDAKSGKQVSLSAMSEAGSLMRQLKNDAIYSGINSLNSLTADSMRASVPVTKNNLSIGYNADSFVSNFDKSDTSGQTYDSHSIRETGKKLDYAKEALKILRNAQDVFGDMKRDDVEKFVNDYVKSNLTPGLAAKFKGVKWETYHFPS